MGKFRPWKETRGMTTLRNGVDMDTLKGRGPGGEITRQARPV